MLCIRTAAPFRGTSLQTNDIAIENDEAQPLGQRQIQREKRTAEIIEASLRVFAEEGHAGYSLRKVAAAAGVRLNTVQHHFGDLNSLLVATVRAKMGDYVARYREMALVDQIPPRDRFEAALDDIFMEIRKPEVRKFFFELWTLARHDKAIGELVNDAYTGYVESLAGLAIGIQPDLSPVEAKVLGTMIAAWTEGLVVIADYGDPGKRSFGAVVVRMKAACLSLFGTVGKTPGSTAP